jgi:hypothetical protein
VRRAVLAGLVAGLAVLGGLWFAAMSFRGARTPAHTASAAVPALGLTVTAELFALSDLTEFERHLKVSAADGATLRARMGEVRGPTDRTSLYRAGEREIAVVGPLGNEGRFFAAEPLRRLDRPSRPASDWTCLGAFELSVVPNAGDPARGRQQVFAFVPAAGEEERGEAAGGRGCEAGRPPPR